METLQIVVWVNLLVIYTSTKLFLKGFILCFFPRFFFYISYVRNTPFFSL